MQKIFDRLKTTNITLGQDKCHFCRAELRYLGYVVDRRGLHVDPEKVEAITGIPTPTCVADVRRFIGMTSWYRRFVQDFSSIIAPLTNLLKKNRRWEWNPECEAAFTTLKERLITAPILTCPDFTKPFVVQTDASAYGLGAVLTQTLDDGEHVVSFLSRTLSKAERNYSTTERECLAVVWALEKLRPYLEGTRFSVVTDHYSLVWLHNIKQPTGKLCRWMLKLQQYDFSITHRKGKDHVVPDCLSHGVVITDAVQTAPAGGRAAHSRAAAQPTIADGRPAPEDGIRPRDAWVQSVIKRVQQKPHKYPQWRVEGDVLLKYVGDCDPNLMDGDENWKEVVPKDRRKELLKSVHDVPTAGHPGVQKTYHRLRARYYWPKMRADVAAYVRRCPTCVAYKAPQQKPAGFMGSRPRVYRPFQLVSADIMGPLPRSAKGYRYILVVCDYFSKFVLTVPLRTATAASVVSFCEEQVFLSYGVPQFLICDNGVQFRSREFRGLCERYNVRILYNALYHPQNNPTERVNRVIKTMLASYVKDDHRRWDRYLPAVTCAIRTQKHDVTGFTPYFVNFGREQILDGRDYQAEGLDPAKVVSYDRDSVPVLRPEGFRDIYARVRTQLDRAYERNARTYNLRRRDAEYHVGQRVWRRNFALSRATDFFAHKLAPKFVGPFRVTKKLSRVTYELSDDDGRIDGNWHVKDLKPQPDDDNTDLRDESELDAHASDTH